jgi:Kef-type K+ transport system membrane component KefB
MIDVQISSGVEADLKKLTKVGRGKRDLILITALVVVAVLIGVVWAGFRGNHVSRSAAAMAAPVPATAPRSVSRSTTP